MVLSFCSFKAGPWAGLAFFLYFLKVVSERNLHRIAGDDALFFFLQCRLLLIYFLLQYAQLFFVPSYLSLGL